MAEGPFLPAWAAVPARLSIEDQPLRPPSQSAGTLKKTPKV
nr:hypothetical protein OG999_10125 [Streptomyces sp. NBC_00886]